MPDLEAATMPPASEQGSCTCVLLDLGTLCGGPTEVEFVMGCVNEHLDVDFLCARHAYLARDGDLVCTVCAPLGVREIAHVLSENGRRVLL